MASFESWMLPHKRRLRRILAGFQDDPRDSGNWSSGRVGEGVLIGTNRSVSAPTLIDWRGRQVTKAEMEALSVAEAKEIFRAEVWNKVNGDKIKDQLTADLLADMFSSAGYNATKIMQRVLNDLGENLVIDGVFGSKSVEALNRQITRKGAAKVYNNFREAMVSFYASRTSPFKNQWIDSLKEDYPLREEQINYSFWVVAVVIVLLGLYGIYEYKKVE